MKRDPLRPFLLLALAALSLWAAVFVVRRFSAEPAWADSSGYFNSAKLLTSGQFTGILRLPPVLDDPYPYDFEPLGFHYDTPRARLVPTYFVGLPLLLAAGDALVGWRGAPYLVELGFGLLAVACTYALQRHFGVGRLLALAVALNLAWCPVFVFGVTQPYSDTVATALCALAALGAVKGSERGRAWYGLAGAALGLGIVVRSTDALLLPALLVLVPIWRGRRTLLLGAAAPVALLLAYQRVLYGSALRSGYGDIFRIFGWAYVPGSLAAYALVLPKLLPIAVFGLAGLLSAHRHLGARARAGLVLWIAPFGLFYAFYIWTGQHWTYLRFIEPSFPALIVLAGAGLQHLAQAGSRRGPGSLPLPSLAAGTALALAAAVAALSHYPNPRAHDRGFAAARAWMSRELPPRALVICESFSGTVYFAAPNPILRWDISAPRNTLKYLREMTAAGLPVYALLDAAEAADPRLQARVPARWEKVADLDTASAWRVYLP